MDELNRTYLIRFTAFTVMLLTLVCLERLTPRRARRYPVGKRWLANFGLLAIDVGATRLLGPISSLAVAYWAEGRGVGLLALTELPVTAKFAISILALDLVIWIQHLAFHKLPLLWRLHRVHHLDRELDATTGVRFHPMEIALSLLVKAVAVIALGAPVAAVVAFELVLNLVTLFNHANLGLPLAVERAIRWICVTPDMHRIHHSVHRDETDSNFGFNLPWWDRLFGTYRDQPRDGHRDMELGLADWRSDEVDRLPWLAGRSIFL